jgi:hypothetical protein
VPNQRDNDAERLARIDMILEELRLNTEDLRELAARARKRAKDMRATNRVIREEARDRQRRRKK